MPSVPPPADPGWDEDPAWLDRVCELDELTAEELAGIRQAAADEMLALDAASTGRRGGWRLG